jgi:acyl-coenzyme A synthetase/AMP-(fatty) acid ligase
MAEGTTVDSDAGLGRTRWISNIHYEENDLSSQGYIHDFKNDEQQSNLADIVIGKQLREGRASATALVFRGKPFTYQDLASAALDFQRKLLPLIGVGDHVAIMMADCPSFAASFFGIVAAGAIASPVNPRLALPDVSTLLKRMRPSVIVATPDVAPDLRGLVNEMQLQVLIVDYEYLDSGPATWDPCALIGGGADNAYCLFSSGTTGEPKGVIHDHRAVLACMNAFESGVLPIQSTDRIIATPKLTFGYGLIGNLLFGLLAGGSSILIREPYELDLFVCAIERDKPSMLLGQPRILAQIIEQNVAPRSLDSVKVCLSAGEKLETSLYNRWVSRYDIPFVDVVGSTELGHIFIANRPGHERPGSAGQLLPGFEARIVKDDGADAEVNERGELFARGVGMTRLYCNDPERTANLASRQWVRTGDLFSCSEDGYYTMHGRVDDLIKVGCGQWITPTELEEVLGKDPEVSESAVVGGTNRDGFVEVCGFLVPAQTNVDIDGLVERLQSALRERWPGESHKHIEEFQVIEKMPRTINGKIDRKSLRACKEWTTESNSRFCSSQARSG